MSLGWAAREPGVILASREGQLVAGLGDRRLASSRSPLHRRNVNLQLGWGIADWRARGLIASRERQLVAGLGDRRFASLQSHCIDGTSTCRWVGGSPIGELAVSLHRRNVNLSMGWGIARQGAWGLSCTEGTSACS
jgi:hypothetical protein